ncbi:MAG: HAMP domain-containing histidine kinase [Flavobacteriales bacterium]|nr:HAMP domain-containing histidine kinase [Flavobacteriales bacterium]
MNSTRRTLWLFGALVFYAGAQSIWWAVLLLRRDREISALQARSSGLVEATDPAAEGSRRALMVLGEAAVFLLLLLALLVLVYRSVQRDLRLAAAQRNFLLAVTHELRSPIAAIKLQLSTLARSDLQPVQRYELRQGALEEVDRLAALTDKVLQATAAEEGTMPLRIEQVDVMPIVRNVAERARADAARDHYLKVVGPDSLVVGMDAHALRSIAENLIENAAKYAPSGSTIEVEVRPMGPSWDLLVSDEGPGVAQEERERIFERFHRSGSEEVRATQGTGLGLYIVRRLSQRLGGSVDVRPRAPKGSIFAASFPQR